jgi:hypothetical protein
LHDIVIVSLFAFFESFEPRKRREKGKEEEEKEHHHLLFRARNRRRSSSSSFRETNAERVRDKK